MRSVSNSQNDFFSPIRFNKAILNDYRAEKTYQMCLCVLEYNQRFSYALMLK